MGLKSLMVLFAAAQAAFAVNVEAPPEIAEQVLAYAAEAGAGYGAILRVNMAKKRLCNAYSLKLIDAYSGKTLKKIEFCSAELPNLELQNAVLEIFGRYESGREEPLIEENGFLAILGAGFAAAGLVLYYSKPPKPVFGYKLREGGK